MRGSVDGGDPLGREQIDLVLAVKAAGRNSMLARSCLPSKNPLERGGRW